MRLFIAIIFSEKFKTALLEASDYLRTVCKDGNFTHPNNLHETIVFIGEANGAQTEKIKRIMQQDPMPTTNIELDRIERIRRGDRFLCWAKIKENKTVENYCTTISEELRKSGFYIENRPFRPHVTLVRNGVFEEKTGYVFTDASMQVNRVSLMVSERIGGRLVYTELFSVQTV